MGLVLILTYIALNLLSVGDLFPSLAPFRPALILAIASVPTVVFARLQTPEVGKLRTQFLLVTLFFGFLCCSWLPHGWWGGGLMALGAFAPNVLVYFLATVLLRTPTRLQFVRTTMVLVALFVIFSALAELPHARATGMTTPYVLSGGSALNPDTRIRGLGTLHDPNTFGQFLLMIIPMLYVARKEGGLGMRYLIALPLTALFIVAILLTNSRGAEIGLAVIVGLYLIRRFKGFGMLLSAAVGTLTLLAVNIYRTRTISMDQGMDRLAIWSEGMQYFKNSPVWGIGFRSFTDREGMTAHNSYLLCASELGFIGYFLWMGALVVTFIQLNRVEKVVGHSDPALARWALALKLSLGVYLFTSFFLSRAYDLPLYLLLGMSGAVVVAAGGDDAIPLRGTKWPLWTMGYCVGLLTLIYVMLRLRAV